MDGLLLRPRAGIASTALRTTVSGGQWCRMSQPSASNVLAGGAERYPAPIGAPSLPLSACVDFDFANFADFDDSGELPAACDASTCPVLAILPAMSRTFSNRGNWPQGPFSSIFS